MKKLYIVKSNNKREPYDENKIIQSLENSKANEDTIQEILKKMREIVYPGITTEEIYWTIDRLLREESKKSYLRYNLTSAISQLGPEGFAFEAFIAEVVKKYNYKNVITGKIIQGKCMHHELDIVAENDDEILTIEAKFHNSRSKKSDLQVILYMKARFQDIIDGGFYGDKKAHQLIITNTKFTDNAKRYAKCSGTQILSWDYPNEFNLHDYILNSGVHPMTSLVSIPKKVKEFFVSKKITTVQQIAKNNFEVLKECKFLSKDDLLKIEEEVSKYFHDKIS